jgi:hypothetical protein
MIRHCAWESRLRGERHKLQQHPYLLVRHLQSFLLLLHLSCKQTNPSDRLHLPRSTDRESWNSLCEGEGDKETLTADKVVSSSRWCVLNNVCLAPLSLSLSLAGTDHITESYEDGVGLMKSRGQTPAIHQSRMWLEYYNHDIKYCDVLNGYTSQIITEYVGWLDLLTLSYTRTLTYNQLQSVQRYSWFTLLQFAVANALGFPLFPLVVSKQRLSTHTISFTLRLLHISLLFTEALFTIHAENSSRL